MQTLYEKYRITDYKDLPTLNPLSFILRKAELGLDLTVSEWDWLEQHQLVETKEIIKSQENYRVSLRQEIRQELMQLKKNRFLYYSVNRIPAVDSETAFILYKVHAQERLADSELRYVGQGYHPFLDFNERKQKYGITDDIPYDEMAKSILSKIENKIRCCVADIEWLCTHKAYSFLTPLKNQFSQLQTQYKVNLYDKSAVDLLFIFYILQKLDENKHLDFPETEYLKTLGLIETLEISQKIEFIALKKKYQATQSQDEEINSHLFKVLKKLEAGLALAEQDINYLKKRKLFETLRFNYQKQADTLNNKIKQNHGLRPEDVIWCEEHDFKEIIFDWLKKDYNISRRKDKPESPLYLILKKLQTGHRLIDDVVWLEGEKLLNPTTKIFIAHHTLEAQFNESEFQRTKDYWKLANASAHWRKAEKPKWALKQTDNLDFKKIKPAKLRAALLTTRGGAFRDINEFNNAEHCALDAIKHFPDSHNPYTLMGALCYDTGRYEEGDRWFAEAVKRGAKPQDQDAEIKRILRKKKGDKLEKLIEHLLKKDPIRFAWVKKHQKI
jgi:hypothetical protein